jgi:hypothetical protein
MSEKKFYADPHVIGPLEMKPNQLLGTGAAKIPAFPVAGWDPSDGIVKILNLGCLVWPLVQAERLHTLGLLDGREEDYDMQTVTIPTAAQIGAIVTGQLTVPAGEVWFLHAVSMTLPADVGGSPTMNWHCDLWTDRVGASPYGQPFHATAVNFSPGGGTQYDEFGYPAPFWVLTNKPEPLRLPAGKKITFVVANTVAQATGPMACVGRLYGWKGLKILE